MEKQAKVKRIFKSTVLGMLCMFFMLSCFKRAEEGNVTLISSSSEFMFEDGPEVDGYYSDREQFIKPYTELIYKSNDTLVVSTLKELNSCSERKGAIEVSNDTIHLLVQENLDVACKSVEFHKFTYLIHGKEVKKYHIAY